FQRFYRCDDGSQHSGFGLGLSIVAAIINLHGFSLEIGTSDRAGARLILECKDSLIAVD
ncbi:ATP-binding protein, partial [Pseudomonas gingeri]|nr:two-component sensor histidine kinase [Pseudomonas gingeri]